MLYFISPDSHYVCADNDAKAQSPATNEPAAPLGHLLGRRTDMRAFRYGPILPILRLEDERSSLPTLCANLILINIGRFTTMASLARIPWLPL